MNKRTFLKSSALREAGVWDRCLFFISFLFLFSCKSKTEKRNILLKYYWVSAEGARLGRDVVFFDTVRSRDTGCVLFIDRNLSIFRDGIWVGTISKVYGDNFDFRRLDNKEGTYEVVNEIESEERVKILK